MPSVMQPLLPNGGVTFGSTTLSSVQGSMLGESKNGTNKTWNSAAQGLVKAADVERSTCKNLRQEVSRMDQYLQRAVREKAGQVEGSLKVKMMTTKHLRDNIKKHLMSLGQTTEGLVRAMERAEEAVSALRKPLKGTASRQHLRSSRNDRENYFEEIDQHLAEEVQVLHSGLDTLQSLMTKGKTSLESLRRSTATLESDIGDKTKAYELDMQCLATQPVSTTAPHPVKKELTMAVSDGTLASNSVFLPSIWRGTTENELAAAAQIDASAKLLTKTILNTIEGIYKCHELNRSRTFSAFRSKVKQASVLRSHISARICVLTEELENLTMQRDVLKKSLEDKQMPLSVLQQRVAVRKLRPAREAVRDEVEEAMQGELQELLKSVNVLNDRVDSIEGEMRKLKANKKFLSIDLRDKDCTLRVDKKCLDLIDGATTPAISEPATPYSTLTASTSYAARNHQYTLHIINSLKPKNPKPPEAQQLAKVGKRQYPKPSRSITMGTC